MKNEWWIVGALGLGAVLLFSNDISHHAAKAAPKAAAAPKPGGPAPPLIPASTAAPTAGGTLYPAVSHYPISNPAGQNQSITYASSGKAAQSHRVDVNGTSNPAQEATVYLAWPAACTGGGHPELAIKHWGPAHTDSNCCYHYGAAVPSGGSLQLGGGGEGPHPSTTTIQHPYTSIPFTAGKIYGFKSIIWPNPGGGAHAEMYYDNGSGKWTLAGKWDRPTVGQNKTSTTIAPGAQVEFRIDCSNVTFQHTDVAAIKPGGAPALGAMGQVLGLAGQFVAPKARGWKRPTSRHTVVDECDH